MEGIPSSHKMSFADKIKSNPAMQIAVYAEPMREFKESDKLEFLDAVGDAIFEITEGSEVPQFLFTARRGPYIIVESANEKSQTWLKNIVPTLNILEGSKLNVIPANEITKLKKGLLWLPGKKKLPNDDLLKRIKKQNPELQATKWKVFSRHEEEHGIRLLIGIEEESVKAMLCKENKPQWSTSRAQYTPIEEVIKRKKEIKDGEKMGKTGGDANEKVLPGTMGKQINEAKSGFKSQKRKPDTSLNSLSPAEVKKAEKEILGGKESPFAPTRPLARSPIASKDKEKPFMRPLKRMKDNGSEINSAESNVPKITDFFRSRSDSQIESKCTSSSPKLDDGVETDTSHPHE